MSTAETVTVYEPHMRGVPPLGAYLRRLWLRRRFGWAKARADLKAQHFNTFFGQLWTVLNPMLLAVIYFLVVGLIRGGERGDPKYLAQLLGGLFCFYYTRNAIAYGAKSIVGGGALITNTAVPRALLPLSSVLSALLVYGPMLLVYAGLHLIGGYPVGPQLLALVPLTVLQTVFNCGLALAFAALTVYFRDTSSFLPYMLRIWLYLSPVLWRLDTVPEALRPLLFANPLTPLLTAWQQILLDGRWPEARLLLTMTGWAVASLVVGALFFLSREREFAVRL